MRSDALGIFWRDEPPVAKVKVEKPKRTPPPRTWEDPSYLPGLEEALAFNVPLFTDQELFVATSEGLVYDIECYPNYFLVAFKSIVSGKVVYFEMKSNESMDLLKLGWVLENFLTIGFNSLNYDNPIVTLALAGADCAELQRATEEIIVMQMRPSDMLRSRKLKMVKYNHIDLIEVAPLRANLKIYGGRVHTKRMQDLPFPPGTVLSDNQIAIVRWYCINDLNNTHDLYNKLHEQVHLREQLTAEYGIDLRSKSDAQIAEAVIGKEVEALNGVRPQRPIIPIGTWYKYKVPHFIKYQSPLMNWALDIVRSANFIVDDSGSIGMPPELKELEIKLAYGTYRMGIGGLHSSEKKQAVVATSEYMLKDVDVTSYYPRIILNQGLFPRHLGTNFLKVYGQIVHRRITAKEGAGKIKKLLKTEGLASNVVVRYNEQLEELTVTSDSLKITINGSFGTLGSQYSILYAPDLLIQTTVTGQLALLMLIERLEIQGFHVISANTDGIIIYCRRSREQEMNAIVKQWEQDTNFETEETLYKAVYSRDVNNYIAVKENVKDDPKVKGAYSKAGLHKNPTNEICIIAIEKLLCHGTPIDKTIRECDDVRKFVSVRSVKGGAVKDGEYLGKSIRWYYAQGEEGEIIYASNGNKVPKSDGAKPLMTLPDTLPDDINYDWYIEETYDMLRDIGYMQ